MVACGPLCYRCGRDKAPFLTAPTRSAPTLFALKKLALAQLLPVCIGLLFVLFLAKRVSQLVGNGQVEKVVHAKRPLPHQLPAPRRDGTPQPLLKERLPPVQNRECRT